MWYRIVNVCNKKISLLYEIVNLHGSEARGFGNNKNNSTNSSHVSNSGVCHKLH